MHVDNGSAHTEWISVIKKNDTALLMNLSKKIRIWLVFENMLLAYKCIIIPITYYSKGYIGHEMKSL